MVTKKTFFLPDEKLIKKPAFTTNMQYPEKLPITELEAILEELTEAQKAGYILRDGRTISLIKNSTFYKNKQTRNHDALQPIPL